MDINRNQFFLAGLLLLLLGVQFRMVDSFVLTPEFSKMITKQQGRPVATASFSIQSMLPTNGPAPARTVHPPEWLGWLLVSAGSVLILHSLAMKKPEGQG